MGDRTIKALQAGLTLFEYLGELLNSIDAAADDENLPRIGELAEMIKAELTEAERQEAVREAHVMLGVRCVLSPGGESEDQ